MISFPAFAFAVVAKFPRVGLLSFFRKLKTPRLALKVNSLKYASRPCFMSTMGDLPRKSFPEPNHYHQPQPAQPAPTNEHSKVLPLEHQRKSVRNTGAGGTIENENSNDQPLKPEVVSVRRIKVFGNSRVFSRVSFLFNYNTETQKKLKAELKKVPGNFNIGFDKEFGWHVRDNSAVIRCARTVFLKQQYDVTQLDDLLLLDASRSGPGKTRSESWAGIGPEAIEIRTERGRIYMRWPFIYVETIRKHVNNIVKGIDGWRFHGEDKFWSIPENLASNLADQVQSIYHDLAVALRREIGQLDHQYQEFIQTDMVTDNVKPANDNNVDSNDLVSCPMNTLRVFAIVDHFHEEVRVNWSYPKDEMERDRILTVIRRIGKWDSRAKNWIVTLANAREFSKSMRNINVSISRAVDAALKDSSLVSASRRKRLDDSIFENDKSLRVANDMVLLKTSLNGQVDEWGVVYDRINHEYRIHRPLTPWIATAILSHIDSKRLDVIPLVEKNSSAMSTQPSLVQSFLEELNATKIKSEQMKLLSCSTTCDMSNQLLSSLAIQLLPSQKANIEYMRLGSGRYILNDSMGLGKTASAIATIMTLSALPAVVVVPTCTVENWRREILRFHKNEMRILILSGREPSEDEILHSFDYILLPHSIVKDRVEQLSAFNFQSLVVDESHCFKNSAAMRTSALKEISENKKDIILKLLLTGTPVKKTMRDIYPQLQIADLNKHFAPTYVDFVQIYSGYRDSTPEELNRRAELFMSRARSFCLMSHSINDSSVVQMLHDANIDYGGMVSVNHYLSTADSRWRNYFLAHKDLFTFLRRCGVEKQNHISQEIINNLDKAQRAQALVRLTICRKEAAKAKLLDVIQLVEMTLQENEDEKVLVFGHHIEEMILPLSNHFGCEHITGDISGQKRQDIVDRFQNDEESRVIVLSALAAGLGINLTSASIVIHAETHYGPTEKDQASARSNRIGQTKEVTVIQVIATNTVDEDLVAMEKEKRNVTKVFS